MLSRSLVDQTPAQVTKTEPQNWTTNPITTRQPLKPVSRTNTITMAMINLSTMKDKEKRVYMMTEINLETEQNRNTENKNKE